MKMTSEQPLAVDDSQETQTAEHLRADPLPDASVSKRRVYRRPTDKDMLDALKNYRLDTGDALGRGLLAICLDSAVGFAIRGFVRKFPYLAPSEEDLVQSVWLRRLLKQEQKDGELLADYEPDMVGKRSVYSWVWYLCRKEILDEWAASKAQRRALMDALNAFEFEPDDEDHKQTTPEQLKVSETPLRGSILRVHTLMPWLVALANDMLGKELTLTMTDGSSTCVRFNSGHKDIWLQWLALKESDDEGLAANYNLLDLNGLAEQELADTLGLPKKRIQDRTDEAFSFMLQHEDLPKYLDLMMPNSLPDTGESREARRSRMLQTLKAKKVDAVVDGKQSKPISGKTMFRALVHVWVRAHYAAT